MYGNHIFGACLGAVGLCWWFGWLEWFWSLGRRDCRGESILRLRKVCPGFHVDGVYVYGDSAEMLRSVRSMQTI
jgi:hypothetical protein